MSKSAPVVVMVMMRSKTPAGMSPSSFVEPAGNVSSKESIIGTAFDGGLAADGAETVVATLVGDDADTVVAAFVGEGGETVVATFVGGETLVAMFVGDGAESVVAAFVGEGGETL
jgi:hypothetical protein